MAKISARGATRLFSVDAEREGTIFRFTVTSDGRVLRQVRINSKLTAFNQYGTIHQPANRTQDWLKGFLADKGYNVDWKKP